MASWRVHVTCADEMDAFKDRFYKQLYNTAGSTLSFEVPETDEAAADAIVEAAKGAGHEAKKEKFEDPLEQADSVDFW